MSAFKEEFDFGATTKFEETKAKEAGEKQAGAPAYRKKDFFDALDVDAKIEEEGGGRRKQDVETFGKFRNQRGGPRRYNGPKQ